MLTGYGDPPAGLKMQEGMNYNEYFPGHQIAMPPPLADGTVTYRRRHQGDRGAGGEGRRQLPDVGGRAQARRAQALSASRSMLFLVVLALMLYAVKRKVWAAIH